MPIFEMIKPVPWFIIAVRRFRGMAGNTVRLFVFSALLMAGSIHASAETAAAPETVTVTATKLREVFHKFLKGFVAPTEVTGKIAFWKRRICPHVLGQNSHFNTFIAQRIKYVALAAGARVNTEASCTPNVEVVFTTTPQALLDNVRRHDVFWLGYAESTAQLDQLATVTRPIQAWYTTETTDANGMRFTDSAILSSVNGQAQFEPAAFASTGSRINNGIESGFKHILIVVDSTKLAGQKIVPLADYIALLALTQVSSLDTCQPLISIVNILAKDCGQVEDGLTQFDIAYLQGLYKMSADKGLMFQRNDIASVMADALMPEE
jgi:hypothetical protein